MTRSSKDDQERLWSRKAPISRTVMVYTSGLKPKSTIHWLSAERAIPAEIRLYDRLFTVEDLPMMTGPA
ncbi:MAG: hypothetical protein R2787_01515 [Saprospiraceae bacterium]